MIISWGLLFFHQLSQRHRSVRHVLRNSMKAIIFLDLSKGTGQWAMHWEILLKKVLPVGFFTIFVFIILFILLLPYFGRIQKFHQMAINAKADESQFSSPLSLCMWPLFFSSPKYIIGIIIFTDEKPNTINFNIFNT